MKKIYSILFVLLLLNTSSSCEKDDICDPDTPTTPRLTITFYNTRDREELLPVTNLLIKGVGMEREVGNFNGVSTIQIPLDISKNSAKFVMTLNSKSLNPENIYTDTLEFNYSRQSLYVSEACGYKTIFDLNKDTLPNAYVINNNPEAIRGTWIDKILIVNYNVVYENETQVNIYYFL